MKQSNRAFTLIELLVVISIIAILAAIALPVLQRALIQGQKAQAVSQARQIGLALHMYANDSLGVFPSGTNSYGDHILTSNDAFRSLFPSYVGDERIFTVSRAKVGSKCDGVVDPPTEILKTGENHYAYVEGLSNMSNSIWPLLMDCTDGNGKYTTTETDPAGTWQGVSAIVVNVDSSASIVRLKGTGASCYIPRFDDPTKNALDVSAYMGTGVALLDPAQ